MHGVNDQFWQFVETHLNDEPSKLRLKYHGKPGEGLDIDLAITQIECRKRFGKKLSETLSSHPHWLFANTLAGEQSTSDRLARYHASLISCGDSVVDLTAGLGIDALHMSTKASSVTAVEIDQAKADALKYNFASTSVQIICADCREYIDGCAHCDVAFIDPARRAYDGSRVYALSQCRPDVVEMLPHLSKMANRLIIKMSPMLDITQVIRELPNVREIVALGTETECKELIAVVDLLSSDADSPMVNAVTLKNDGTASTLTFTQDDERLAVQQGSAAAIEEGMYLYDPYPAVMKSAPYKLLADKYAVSKVSSNTHLYYSAVKVDDFPGQAYKIERVIPYNSKYIKRLKKDYPRLGVSTRNFDISADKLRAKLGVNDGGDHRLYAVTLSNGDRVMIIARC